jgi:hypothetical protein
LEKANVKINKKTSISVSVLATNEPNPPDGPTVGSNVPKIRVRRQVKVPHLKKIKTRKPDGTVAFIYTYNRSNAFGKQRHPLKALSGATGNAKTGPQGSEAVAQADSSVTATGGETGQYPGSTNSRTYTFVHNINDYGNGSISGNTGYVETSSDTQSVNGRETANAGASSVMNTFNSNGENQSNALAQATSNSNAVAGPDGSFASSMSDRSSDANFYSPDKNYQTYNSGGSNVMAKGKGPGPINAGTSTFGSSSAKGSEGVASKGAASADVFGSNIEAEVDSYASLLGIHFKSFILFFLFL